MTHLKKSIWALLLLEAFIIFSLFLYMINVYGTKVSCFVDVLNLLFILLPAIPILLVSGMAKDFVTAFTIGRKKCSLLQMKKSLEAIHMLQRLILCGVGFSVAIETIAYLQTMSNPATIGPSLATIIFSMFYGILLECMMIPLSTFVQNHIIDAMNVEDEEV